MNNLTKKISCAFLAATMAVSTLTFSVSALKETPVNTDKAAVQSYLLNTASKTALILPPKIKSLSNTTSGISVSWNSVKGAGKYRLFKKTGSSKSWKKVADTKSTKFTDKKVSSGSKYTYALCCLDSKGKVNSLTGSSKSITFIASPKITSITNTASGPIIKWSKVKGTSKYRVFYLSGKTWKTLATTSSASYTHKSAKSGTKYTYTVRCLNSKGKYIGSYDKTGKANKFVKPKTDTAKEAIVKKYVDAVNAAKKEKNMTVHHTFNTTMEVKKTSPDWINDIVSNLLQGIIPPGDYTYKFKNGKADDEFDVYTPNDILPPAGKKCTLRASDIKSAKEKKTSSGTVYTLTLKSESTDLKNKTAEIHRRCSSTTFDAGSISNLDISPARFREIKTQCPATVITATLNKSGKITKINMKMPYTLDITAGFISIEGSATLDGTFTDTFTIKY